MSEKNREMFDGSFDGGLDGPPISEPDYEEEQARLAKELKELQEKSEPYNPEAETEEQKETLKEAYWLYHTIWLSLVHLEHEQGNKKAGDFIRSYLETKKEWNEIPRIFDYKLFHIVSGSTPPEEGTPYFDLPGHQMAEAIKRLNQEIRKAVEDHEIELEG